MKAVTLRSGKELQTPRKDQEKKKEKEFEDREKSVKIEESDEKASPELLREY